MSTVVRRGRWWTRDRALLVLLLVATAVAYCWNLSVNGYANEYYSMAVQAASESWKAWFFGALDAAGGITVDKTPASLWLMGLSVRLLGFSSFSMLLPQALLGVASVAVLYASVKRWFGASAALLAGAVLATTPVAALMFRFNNPDALLVFLMVAAAWAVTRAIDADKALRWLVLAGLLIGFAFLTKMLQAFLVLPGLALAYGVAGSAQLRTRLLHLVAAAGSVVVGAGWWVLAVELWPAAARPYIGGSTTNSILELTLGYNGLGRLNGDEAGSVGSMWGTPGLGRLFSPEMQTQASWLLPAALVALVVLLAVSWRAARTDRTRAFATVWGGWLLVTGLTFSLMQGIIHSYYTVALAPAVAALVGAGTVLLWRRRTELLPRTVLAGAVLLTGLWQWRLLVDTPTFLPWLRWVVVGAAVLGATLLLVGYELTLTRDATRRLALTTAVLVAVASLAAPAASAAATIGSAHTGSIVAAGPSTVGGPGGGPGGVPGGAPPGGAPPGGAPGAPGGPGGGGASFLGGGGTSGVSDELVELLQDGDYRWAAAAQTANGAAPLQLASGEPVLAIGGFNGTDSFPTLAQFQEWVADGQIHYYVAGTGHGGGANTEIETWVSENFAAQNVDGTTVYDLTTGQD
ncbi:glycosyltransferase family 39 protein [Mumia sp. zg.B53]|uniref:glycosyltransferase family 39 protein n=1 Tax=Mumia sp. zg.B53 TaxID=2855449 RepID=UPI001C6E2223|nr:glycosyltransferase family 39 protein [Mumia sp. zg.B53]MBW9215024.1 glycosyltransferase family 39 protein [Mumia sp. zg.B53]